MLAEFDRQVQVLTGSGLAESLGLSHSEFGESLAPLRHEIAGIAEREVSAPAGASFVVVPELAPGDLAHAVSLLHLAGSSKIGVVDRNHGPDGLAPFRALPELGVPGKGPYLLVDVERGEEFCDVRPRDAVATLTARARTPLTIAEGIALHLARPDLLQKNRCFMLAGSRRGDRRVPALWISDGAPKLGWCWEGNPHSWLGTASAAGRRAAALVN